MGVSDVVVAVSPEGILVSDKACADYIKPYVEKINSRVMFAEKSWGSFRILDAGESWLTIKVTLNAGHCMNYHSHARRDELWTVIEGDGYAIIDGTEIKLSVGSVIRIPRGARHTVFAYTELKLIEVQTGDEITVADKQKFALPEKS
jgi:mannose-1-phosphate guanylyltransferase